ncbi:MAG: 30S ribosomal protein S6, partial [Paracoccus sp. (in: a-proteobacteria)]
MERLARLHDDVMRIMTIRVDEHEEGPSVQMQKREERGERRERRERN